jgi:hypothetical protein
MIEPFPPPASSGMVLMDKHMTPPGASEEGVRQGPHSRSMATLDAIGCRHLVSICPILPRWTPWSSTSAQKMELWHYEIAVLKLAFKMHKIGPLLSSPKQHAA